MQKFPHIPVSTPRDTNKKLSESMSKVMKRLWSDPDYRKMLIEKQRKAGLRAYGSKLSNKKYE